MDVSQIKKPIDQEFKCFEKLFSESFVTDNPILKYVYSKLKLTKGKQLRPILTLLAAKLCGGVTKSSYYTALTMELLHTSSLVHDDVVDGSAERRGMPSVNAAFGNKVAVLSGDYLLAHVFALTEHIEQRSILLSLGQLGMSLSDGELLQLLNAEKHLFNEANYVSVITKKTAILFSTCMFAGAESSGKSLSWKSEELRKFGEYIGICFQIRDDVFDYEGDEKIGKPTGIDIREKKITLPLIYAYRHAGEEVRREIEMRLGHGAVTDEDAAYLTAVAVKEGGIDYAYAKMKDYQELAEGCLEGFEDGEVKESLRMALSFVVDRDM